MQRRSVGLAGWMVAVSLAACNADPEAPVATTGGAGQRAGTSTGGGGGQSGAGGQPTFDAARTDDAQLVGDAPATNDVRADTGADGRVEASPEAASMPIPGNCTPPSNINTPYEKLTQTGCVNPANPTQLHARVVPYEVNSPLWSDNAAKTRGMVIPLGKKIHVKDCVATPAECSGLADNGKWVLPVGTVMVKNFLFDQKFVETRLFVHFDEATWVGYGYRWDEAQTEATLVPDQRVTIAFNTGSQSVPWTYPHRQDCMHCHAPANGSTLGLETAQLNRLVGGVNQIDRIAGMDLFETPPAKPYIAALVAPYAIPGQLAGPPPAATLDERARSYLHANCGFCHRPRGAFEFIDLRYDMAMRDRNLCNVVPDKGDTGVLGALNLIPGDPMKSTVWIRMNSLENKVRMPEIASAIVDAQGTKLIADWITSISACPL